MKPVRDPRQVQQLLTSCHPEIASDLAKQVSERGALLEGHFRLQSGNHSSYFLRFAPLGFDHDVVSWIADHLIRSAQFLNDVDRSSITVVAPESVGILLGRAVSDRLEAPLAVVAIDGDRRPTSVFRVGQVAAGHRVLVVNDVITTGKSIAPLLGMGAGPPIGILTYGALSTEPILKLAAKRKIETNWLVAATWRTHDEANCPICLQGESIIPAGMFN